MNVPDLIAADRSLAGATRWASSLGATGLFGGGSLLLDPTGSTMDMPVEWLSGTPSPDYFVPGAVLFGLFGVGSFVVLAGVLRRRTWAWTAAVGLGAALVGLILLRLLLLRIVNVLQVLYGGLGVLLVALAFRPFMRTALTERNGTERARLTVTRAGGPRARRRYRPS